MVRLSKVPSEGNGVAKWQVHPAGAINVRVGGLRVHIYARPLFNPRNCVYGAAQDPVVVLNLVTQILKTQYMARSTGESFLYPSRSL
jgi:hypothetical protein